MKKIPAIILSVFLFSVLSGCTKEKVIVLDESEPLALAPDVQWALVVDPYAAYRQDTSWSSEVLNHCRKGEILKVEGQNLVNGTEVWYNFAYGWLPSSAVAIYSNRLKAKTAAAKLK